MQLTNDEMLGLIAMCIFFTVLVFMVLALITRR
jgi:hypothetical protein